jgi:transcription antitermination factor NusG
MTTAELPWFVVRVRSNFERTIHLNFREKGYDTFLPQYRSRRVWSDRTKETEVPLFPGYVFCRFDPLRRLPILTTPGVITILGSSAGPIPVDTSEVDAVRSLLQTKLPVGPWPFLVKGQSVKIEHGPLAGVEGTVLEVKNGFRLVVSISLLQRSIFAEIDRDWVRPTRAACA